MWTSLWSARLVDLGEMRGSSERCVQREDHVIIAEGRGQRRVHSILRMHVNVLRRVDFEGD